MPLTTGTWHINANAYLGKLEITSVNAQGKVSGTVYGNPIQGFWDEDAKRITFLRIINPADPSTIQVYTGYLFTEQASDHTEWMAGSFEAFSGTGATAQRTVYGWFAEIEIVD